MVSASPKHKAAHDLPTTRCTGCQTVFELPAKLLASTDTRVRCGECLCIFDAREGLVKSKTTPYPRPASGSQIGSQVGSNVRSVKTKKRNRGAKSRVSAAASNEVEGNDDHSALDVTYSDFDLFSEDADLPALAYLDETRDTPEFDFDAVELGEEETFNDTLFSHNATINADLPIGIAVAASGVGLQRAEVDYSVDKIPEEPLIFNYEDPPVLDDDSSKHSTSVEAEPSVHAAGLVDVAESEEIVAKAVLVSAHDSLAKDPLAQHLELQPVRCNSAWVWVFCVLMLIAVLMATVVYPRWHTLDQSPTFRPVKIALCDLVGCRVDTRVDIDSLRVLRREVYEANDRDDALLISIKIQNTADFAQRYPVVEVRMTNRVGRTVAQRGFRPSDYLSDWSRGDTLDAGESVDINLTVNDPGTAAEDHVLQLRELRFDCEPLLNSDGRQRWPADCAEL